MEYNEFASIVADRVSENMGDDITVTINDITKNNSVHLKGICIKKDGISASPTIYLENFHSLFEKGMDINDIAREIIDIYKENAIEDEFDPSFYNDFDKVRGQIYLKIINYDKNLELLNDVPYRKYLDLVLVPYCAIKNEIFGNASILIKNEHVSRWNVSANEVIDAAYFNTKNNMGWEVRPMIDMLGEMLGSNEMPVELNDDITDELAMHVVTNTQRFFGAVFMAFSDKLLELSDTIGGDYYIIPSSIHELILLKKNGHEDPIEINQMIRQINESEVGADEVLSSHVYLYQKGQEVLKF